jgi:hypothetical protein
MLRTVNAIIHKTGGIAMSFSVGGYSFTGRYAIDKIDEIEDWPGLYAILCRRGNRHYLVDIGESNNVKLAIDRSDRKDLWSENCSGTLVVSVYYTLDIQKSERERIERQIRTRHKPPCRKIRKVS